MEPDLAIDVMESTVKIEQSLGSGGRTIGTGFLVSDVDAQGRPRVTLITARHVLDDMPLVSTRIGLRIRDPNSNWVYSPVDLAIRDPQGRPLWTAHPERDIAAIVVVAPRSLTDTAVSIDRLAGAPDAGPAALAPGDEMMSPGFPRGLSSDTAGFPILRVGRVASYPGDANGPPTFLVDFSVYPGNSGSPVFTRPASPGSAGLIAGVLTQQVEVDQQALGIGVVVHARFVRETLGMLDGQAPLGRRSPDTGLRGTNALAREPRRPEPAVP